MKSKIIAAVILSAMLMTTFSACSGGQSEQEDRQEETTVAESDSDETEADDEEEETYEEYSDEDDGENSEFNKQYNIEETVLVDENDVKITATGLDYDNYSVDLKLTIENNSDKNLSFICESIGYSCNSVNGYMIEDGYLNCDVQAGKKANDTVSFSYSELMMHGITEIADIEVGFDISDDDYNHIYTGPRQVKTAAADSYDYDKSSYQEAIDSKALKNEIGYDVSFFKADNFYDKSGISIVSECIIEKDETPLLVIEAINNSENGIYIETSNIDINGLTVESGTWSSDYVTDGKKAVISVDLSSVIDDLVSEAFGINEIGRVSLDMDFVDENDDPVSESVRLDISLPGKDDSFDKTGIEVYNQNGLRIVSKGIYPDESKYIDDMHLILMFENSLDSTIQISDVYNSLSVNGFMTDYSFYGVELESGKNIAQNIRLWEYSLEEIPISNVSEITDIEFQIMVEDGNGKVIDEPTITINNN